MGSARQTQFLKYILCIILKYKCSERTTVIHMNKLFLFLVQWHKGTKPALERWWQQWGSLITHWNHWKYVGKVITWEITREEEYSLKWIFSLKEEVKERNKRDRCVWKVITYRIEDLQQWW